MMTRALVPFSTRMPRGWNDFEREMSGLMRRMFDWDENESELGINPRLNITETETGYEVLSRDAPRTTEEIERLMQSSPEAETSAPCGAITLTS